jgi:hypothetical protein
MYNLFSEKQYPPPKLFLFIFYRLGFKELLRAKKIPKQQKKYKYCVTIRVRQGENRVF